MTTTITADTRGAEPERLVTWLTGNWHDALGVLSELNQAQNTAEDPERRQQLDVRISAAQDAAARIRGVLDEVRQVHTDADTAWAVHESHVREARAAGIYGPHLAGLLLDRSTLWTVDDCARTLGVSSQRIHTMRLVDRATERGVRHPSVFPAPDRIAKLNPLGRGLGGVRQVRWWPGTVRSFGLESGSLQWDPTAGELLVVKHRRYGREPGFRVPPETKAS